MAAAIHALGPADIYVGLRSGGIYYFGTCMYSTEVTPKFYKNEVFNDLAGRNVPLARIDDGMEHDIVMTLNRFDMTVWRAIQAGGVVNRTSGTELSITRGAIHTGLTDVTLTWVYTFPQVAGLVAADVAVGRRYYSCTLRTGFETRKGSRAEELTCMFTATPLFNASSRAFTLFSEDPAVVLAGLPQPN